MKKNIKGFTLIELLATISILGLIMIIVLPRVSNLIGENSNTKYKKYGETVIEASKVYTNSYAEDMFGNDEKSCAQIYLNNLISKGITSDIKLEDTKCANPKTYVKVTKNKDNYKYELSIKCTDGSESKTKYEDNTDLSLDGCEADIYEEIVINDGTKPTINIISPVNDPNTWVGYDAGDITIEIADEDSNLLNPNTILNTNTVKYQWTQSNEAPSSYDNFLEVNDTVEDNKGFKDLKEGKIGLPYGNTGTYFLHVYVDENAVCDEANNCIDAGAQEPIKIKIDTAPPKVPVIEQYKTVREKKCDFWFLWCWKSTTTEKKVKIALDAVVTPLDFPIYTNAKDSPDVGSGFKKFQYKLGETDTKIKDGDNYIHADEYQRTIYYRACDNVGNCSDYATHTIKFNADYLEPTCSTSASPSGWTNQSVTLTGRCSDQTCADKDWLGRCKETVAASGCAQGAIYDYIDYEVNDSFSPGIVYDNAGNSASCDKARVKIDKTDPNPPTYSQRKSENNGNVTVTVSINGIDNLSGIDYYQCSQTGADSKSSFKVSALLGIASTKITKVGTTYLSCYSVDYAGNTSSSSSHTVNISAPQTSPTPSTPTTPSTPSTQEPIPQAPTVKIYEWSNNSGPRPSSGTGLTEIYNNQVTQKKVITVASSPGADHYKYSTTGATTNETDKNGSYRNIEAEGKSQIRYRACNSSGQCSAETSVSVTVVLCNSTKTTWGSAGTCNCKTATQTVKGTKYSTVASSIQCGSDEKQQDCTNYCKTNICSKNGSELFGGNSRNATPGNAGNWTLVSWTSTWCHSKGILCKPIPKNGGWPRICVAPICKGMTAEEINTKYGCDFAPMWCQCNTSNI